MSQSSLSLLLHLSDSLFPIGGYAHSDGLEAATSSGAIAGADDVRAWIATLLDETLARGDAPAVVLAWDAFCDGRWSALRALDDEVHALRPSSTLRQGSRSLGTRLLKTWQRLHAHAGLETMLAGDAGWTHPVAFAAACAAIGADSRSAAEAFLYTRLAAAASAAMRLMPLGQLEAHALVAEALERVPTLCDAVTRRRDLPSAFTPLADIASMRQQYVASRLFRS